MLYRHPPTGKIYQGAVTSYPSGEFAYLCEENPRSLVWSASYQTQEAANQALEHQVAEEMGLERLSQENHVESMPEYERRYLGI